MVTSHLLRTSYLTVAIFCSLSCFTVTTKVVVKSPADADVCSGGEKGGGPCTWCETEDECRDEIDNNCCWRSCKIYLE